MDWSKNEDELIVADYFTMLQKELSHVKFNKSEHRRTLLPLLNKRTDSAIEKKHQNISAVLIRMGLPFIRGYKPLPNTQQLLEEEISLYIQLHKTALEEKFERFAEDTTFLKPPQSIDFEKLIGEAPTPTKPQELKIRYRPIKRNYLKREQDNRILGEAGEKLVLEYERWRLIQAGLEKLAEEVKWVSKDSGDGLGYDILSKNNDGTNRYVEVKTTKLSNETPFYITKNELRFASDFADSFFFYRLYNFNTIPKLFVKQGKYEEFCELQPLTYKGQI